MNTFTTLPEVFTPAFAKSLGFTAYKKYYPMTNYCAWKFMHYGEPVSDIQGGFTRKEALRYLRSAILEGKVSI